MKKRVVFIAGATSSGKSAVAAALAQKLDGEIISCDSMQVYRDMDVITRPPSSKFTSLVKHHLVGILPPEEEFSAARYAEEATNIIDSVISRGRLPVVAGGTGLYMRALIDGIFPSPPKDEALRKRLRDIALENGREYLHERLRKIDPEAAARVHSNDIRRVVRALEVYELTGRAISDKKTEAKGISHKYDCRMFGLEVPRKELYTRIDSTVDKMFDEGLLGEVERLRARRLSLTAGKALGLAEVSDFLKGRISLDRAAEELKKNTRRYAKRQLTWFRAERRMVWVNADRDVGEIVEDIVGKIKEKG